MIYILDQCPKLSAQYLDDRALSRCIESIAQVLCSVHWLECTCYHSPFELSNCNCGIPLKDIETNNPWTNWAITCLANYNWLVKYGEECCREFEYRATYKIGETEYVIALHEMKFVLEWCRDNVPDLPGGQMLCTADMPSSNSMDLITPFPVVMPKKYYAGMFDYKDEEVKHDAIKSYRNYYTHKVQKKLEKIQPTWTRRTAPEWLGLNTNQGD